MAQQVYQGFFDDLAAGNVLTGADCRAQLVMSNTTIDTEADAQTISDFSTYDECDGAGYFELDLGTVTFTYDSANDRMVLDADNGDLDGGVGTVNASSRQITRVNYYRYVDGTAANDVPWASIDIGPYDTVGGPVDITINTTGILYLGQP